jgi:hypothetical protein
MKKTEEQTEKRGKKKELTKWKEKEKVACEFPGVSLMQRKVCQESQQSQHNPLVTAPAGHLPQWDGRNPSHCLLWRPRRRVVLRRRLHQQQSKNQSHFLSRERQSHWMWGQQARAMDGRSRAQRVTSVQQRVVVTSAQ